MDVKHHQKIIWFGGVFAAIISFFLAISLSNFDIIWRAELAMLDSRFIIRGPQISDAHESDIIIVGIDDETFSELDTRWPFPREYYAQAVNNLTSAGVGLIVFDIEFMEKSSGDYRADSLLARAIKEAGNVISAGKFESKTHKNIQGSIDEVHLPIKSIFDSSAGIGLVNIPADSDGFFRRYILFNEFRGEQYPTLAMEAFRIQEENSDDFIIEDNRCFLGDLEIPIWQNAMIINYRGPAKTFPYYSFSNILDTRDFDLKNSDTNYMEEYISTEMPDYIRAINDEIIVLKKRLDLLSESSEKSGEMENLRNQITEQQNLFEMFWKNPAVNTFKDKIVFIGATIDELLDMKSTPFLNFEGASKTPGVECHANALYTLLYKDWIEKLQQNIQYLITALLGIFTFLMIADFKPFKGLIFTTILIILYISAAFGIFWHYSIWIEIMSPVSAIMFTYLGTASIQYLAEQREKRLIKGMFSLYVPDKVVSELINHPEKARLGGERRELTVLFSDIEGFTTISENLAPTDLVTLLNDYLTEMTEIILENGGIIDKYEGDAIMAEFGAPLPNENHVFDGTRTVLAMQRKLVELQKKWVNQGFPLINTRIGLNCGSVALGNFGSKKVFDYTVMGDEVNIASRLEGANKVYNTYMMASENIFINVKNEFIFRQLDKIRVKGIHRPIQVYEIIEESDAKEGIFIKNLSVISRYESALEKYFQQEWQKAILEFRALKEEFNDSPSTTLLLRCLEYEKNPPGSEWDGIFDLISK